MAQFKDMLAYYRKVNGFSQRELAEKVNVSHSAIAMYEAGKRFPTKEIEEALADVFNVSLNNLRGIDNEGSEQYVNLSDLNEENRKKALVYIYKLLELQKMEEDEK